MDTRLQRIAIAGAGIGGLTAALALHDAGFRVSVYERAKALTPIGAGIRITPNAGHVLSHFGLEGALDDDGVVSGVSDYLHWKTGAPLRRLDQSGARAAFGQPHRSLHRADLQRILLDALTRRDPAALNLNRGIVWVRNAADWVDLQFADGGTVRADLLVAADGIRSTVREAVIAPDQPTPTGYVAWRMLVPMAELPDALRLPGGSIGGGRMVIRYVVSRGREMYLCGFTRGDETLGEGWRISATRAEFMDAFAGYNDTVLGTIARAPDAALFKWGLFARPPLDRWARGRVVLLGDAAHPMLPYLAQGAAMAIEDAMILARALVAGDSVAAALDRYQAARIPRVTRVTHAAAATAAMFHDGDYDPARDNSGGALPDLFSYNAVTAPLPAGSASPGASPSSR